MITLDVFCEIPCLTEQSAKLNGLELQKKWFKSADKRIMGQYLHKFVNYNVELFDFLGVTPIISGSDQDTSLSFRSTNFIGSIPLRASDTGKQIGDFVVNPRFIGRNRFSDYIEILNLLENEINPETKESLPLISGANFRPPLYFEALKFINTIEWLSKRHWHKLSNVETISSQPTGTVNWSKYVVNLCKVENQLRFPIKKNVLTEHHSEYAALRYVFDICKKELLSNNTSQKIKNTICPRLNWIENKLYHLKPQYTKQFILRFNDAPIVKECKQIANKILNSQFIESTAWRVDFADVFEKLVQYIFRQIAKEKGGKLYSNYRFYSKSTRNYAWELKHLEPDAIYKSEEITIFIDAKYKSHLYNKFELSEQLKEDYRHDLHQVMAYSSFNAQSYKFAFLCYPSNHPELKQRIFTNRIDQSKAIVYNIGIPLKKDSIRKTIIIVSEAIDSLEERNVELQ